MGMRGPAFAGESSDRDWMRDAECGVRSSGLGMPDVERGVRDARTRRRAKEPGGMGWADRAAPGRAPGGERPARLRAAGSAEPTGGARRALGWRVLLRRPAQPAARCSEADRVARCDRYGCTSRHASARGRRSASSARPAHPLACPARPAVGRPPQQAGGQGQRVDSRRSWRARRRTRRRSWYGRPASSPAGDLARRCRRRESLS